MPRQSSPPELDATPGKLNAQDFLVPVGGALASTAAKQTVLPVKMVPKGAFFRVHSDKVFTGYLLDADDAAGGKDMPFLVHPKIAEQLADPCIRLRHLYPAVTTQKNLYLIPVSPDSGDQWTASKLIVISEARQRWVRAPADKSLGAYSITYPTVQLAEPDWSALEVSASDLLSTAFRSRFIDGIDHPRLKQLRGEI